jgi:16S rRNA (cytosine967-C5)-methyltransferase
MSRLPVDSLGFALLGAAHAVAAVRAGSALPQALSGTFARGGISPQARGAIQDIAFRTMRQLARADALLALLARKTPAQAELRALLCCALALLCDDSEPAPYEAYTVVDQAVRAAAVEPATSHAKGMVNAVLRRFLREREALLAQAMSQPPARWNYPDWWIAAARAAYPQQWEGILSTGNRMPPLTLRVNRRRTDIDAYQQALAAQGIAADRIGPDALRLAQPMPVERIPGFMEGMASVQDAAAQLAAPLLDLQDGMRVLDACAAPGGKTGHILEMAEVELLALDSDPARLLRIEDNLRRLGLRAQVRQGDASASDWWDGQAFDRILADVPCTASGIVRRHPDIRWLRRPDDAARLAALSARILDNLWTMLRPGGKLLLATCSLWPQESELQAAAFAARYASLRLPAPGQLLPTAQAERDHDGLFYALFQKPVL